MTFDPALASSRLRFHLDEHFSPVIAATLSKRGIDTTSTQKAGLLRAKDDAQFHYAQSQCRVFVTSDDDFLKTAVRSSDHCGIVYFPGGPRVIGEIIQALALVAYCLTVDEMRGHVEYM